MITNGHLNIFRNFQYITNPKNPDVASSPFISINNGFDSSNLSISSSVTTFTTDGLRVTPTKQSLVSRLFNSLFRKKQEEKFFKCIKKSLLLIDPRSYTRQKLNLERMMQEAKHNNQIALVEQLQSEYSRMNREMKLFSFGYKIFIEEKDVVKYSESCRLKRDCIRLDWIKNFTRHIPIQISNEISRSKELFDNFVIMHYDPDNKANADTKEEIEKKKDPILFGVMDCSNRLYFIGDWIDNYCDLTLKTFLDKIDVPVYDRVLILDNIIKSALPEKEIQEETPENDIEDVPVIAEEFKCPHCGTSEYPWFDRTITLRSDGREGMAYVCSVCGDEVG